MGKESDFNGVVDLIQLKAFVYGEDGSAKEVDIPADMKDEVEAEREAFIENVAEADDALVEKYLEGEELTDEEIRGALRKGTLERSLAPVLCGSATRNVGIDLLMDFITFAMPSPLDRGAKAGTDPASDESAERSPDPRYQETNKPPLGSSTMPGA